MSAVARFCCCSRDLVSSRGQAPLREIRTLPFPCRPIPVDAAPIHTARYSLAFEIFKLRLPWNKHEFFSSLNYCVFPARKFNRPGKCAGDPFTFHRFNVGKSEFSRKNIARLPDVALT